MVEFFSGPASNAVGVRITGRVSHDDYRQLDGRIRHLVELWNRVGVLIVKVDDRRTSIAARWVAFRLRARWGLHIPRIAVVLAPQREDKVRRDRSRSGMFARYFPENQLDAAWNWVLNR